MLTNQPLTARRAELAAVTTRVLYDELLDGRDEPRPAAVALIEHLRRLGRSELESRQTLADLEILTQGITFTTYDEGANIDRPHLVALEQQREHALHHLAVGQHVGNAARHAQVVLEHVEAAVAAAHGATRLHREETRRTRVRRTVLAW